jgi:hypothetical protein
MKYLPAVLRLVPIIAITMSARAVYESGLGARQYLSSLELIAILMVQFAILFLVARYWAKAWLSAAKLPATLPNVSNHTELSRNLSESLLWGLTTMILFSMLFPFTALMPPHVITTQ